MGMDSSAMTGAKMTWKEFREAVEAKGVRDNDCLDWIDIVYPATGDAINFVVVSQSRRQRCIAIEDYAPPCATEMH
jgi:hypothetical protein